MRIDHRRLVLMSDLHFDHPHADTDLIREHLTLARKINAGIIIGGDLFDAMQTRHDPRRSHGGIRIEHVRDDYLDKLVSDAIALLDPVRDHVLAITDGNHETAALRNASTHLIARVCDALGCVHLPYRGWIEWGDRTIYYAHGGGASSAPVTLGVIDVARQRAWADADVIWNGHTHTAYVVPFARITRGAQRVCWAIRTPSYIRFRLGSGWTDERGLAPQPCGCAVIELVGDGITARLIVT